MGMQQEALAALLADAGYDLTNDNFADTPDRFIRALTTEFRAPSFESRGTTPEQILEHEFEEKFGGIVSVNDIEFKACCAHHIFPFFGHVHIGYMPEGEVVGISKLARLVNYYTNCLTSQEAMTRQITDAVWNIMSPKGVIVMVSAVHTCMIARGGRLNSAYTTTSDVRGTFQTNVGGCKDEWLATINKR